MACCSPMTLCPAVKRWTEWWGSHKLLPATFCGQCHIVMAEVVGTSPHVCCPAKNSACLASVTLADLLPRACKLALNSAALLTARYANEPC